LFNTFSFFYFAVLDEIKKKRLDAVLDETEEFGHHAMRIFVHCLKHVGDISERPVDLAAVVGAEEHIPKDAVLAGNAPAY